MKIRNTVIGGVGVLLAVVGLIGVVGCKVDSADSSMSITPSSISLLKGQSITFSVDGGYNVTWSLENEDWGTLSPRTGTIVVYTSTYRPEESASEVQVVKATSTLWEGGGSSGTNSSSSSTNYSGASYSQTVEAYVTHLKNAI